MLRRTLLAALVVATNPTALLSQVPLVLDFTAQQVVSGLPIRAGEVVNVQVKNFNAQCFSPTFRAEPESADFDASAATRMFAAAGRDTPVTTDQTSPLAGTDRETPLAPLPSPPPPPAASTDQELDDLILSTAAMYLQLLDEDRRSGEAILSLLNGIDCTTAWDVSHLLRLWKAQRASLTRWLREGDDVIPTRDLLTRINREGTPEQKQRSEDLLAAADSIISTAQELASSSGTLDALQAGSEITATASTGADHRALRITVTGSRIRDAARPGDTTSVVREYLIPLKRRHRITFSTGLVATGAPSTHYDRVNRPRQSEDSTAPEHYSTFARQSGNGSDLVNPALMVSASILPVWSMDLHVTAGTTLRTVNGETRLEPLLGAGIGVIDRLFLLTGVHFGRAEDLLLRTAGESVQDVAAREIPSVITRPDAVGVRWKPWLFAGFGLRVN